MWQPHSRTQREPNPRNRPSRNVAEQAKGWGAGRCPESSPSPCTPPGRGRDQTTPKPVLAAPGPSGLLVQRPHLLRPGLRRVKDVGPEPILTLRLPLLEAQVSRCPVTHESVPGTSVSPQRSGSRRELPIVIRKVTYYSIVIMLTIIRRAGSSTAATPEQERDQ